jgi:hypothetical protein
MLTRVGPRYLPGGLPHQLERDGLVLQLVPVRMRAWTFASWFPGA